MKDYNLEGIVMMPQWSLSHRQTSMLLLNQKGAAKHAVNEAFNQKQKRDLTSEVNTKREVVECVVQCPEEAVWEIRVNETACGGIKHIRTGNILELQVTLHLHAQEEDRQTNKKG